MPKFDDSTEATEHIQKIRELLEDPRLRQWAVSSDAMHDSDDCGDSLVDAINAVKKFEEAIESCQ